jgi:hypothetical protein
MPNNMTCRAVEPTSNSGTRLLFRATPVRFPLGVAVVDDDAPAE